MALDSVDTVLSQTINSLNSVQKTNLVVHIVKNFIDNNNLSSLYEIKDFIIENHLYFTSLIVQLTKLLYDKEGAEWFFDNFCNYIVDYNPLIFSILCMKEDTNKIMDIAVRIMNTPTFDPLHTSATGYTPLLFTIKYSNVYFQLTKHLIENLKVDMYQKNSKSQKGIINEMLNSRCDTQTICDVIKYLITQGYNINTIENVGDKVYTALYYACTCFNKSLKIVKLVLDLGADPNIGLNTLISDVMSGFVFYNYDEYVSLFSCLIEHGMDVSKVSSENIILIIRKCIINDNSKLLDIFLKNGMTLNIDTKQYQDPLLDLLHDACWSESVKFVEMLVAMNFDIAKERLGRTAFDLTVDLLYEESYSDFENVCKIINILAMANSNIKLDKLEIVFRRYSKRRLFLYNHGKALEQTLNLCRNIVDITNKDIITL